MHYKINPKRSIIYRGYCFDIIYLDECGTVGVVNTLYKNNLLLERSDIVWKWFANKNRNHFKT